MTRSFFKTMWLSVSDGTRLPCTRDARREPFTPLPRLIPILTLTVLLLPVGAGPAAAGQGEPDETVLHAVRVAEAPELDGVLDEELWQEARVFDRFVQQLPDTGEPPTRRTEVLIVYTEEALYFGVRAYRGDDGRIVASELRYDQPRMFRQDDNFAIMLDTFHDHRNGYLFLFNPLGTRSDWACTEEGRHWNRFWDPIWEVETRVDDAGWYAEVEIPFKSLRYPDGGGTWGINVRRAMLDRNEWVHATRIPPSFAHPSQGIGQLSSAGQLEGLQGITESRDLEIRPYAAVAPRADVPGQEILQDTFDVGVDAKYGIASNVTLDLTYNTDFSQVEVDEQQINLTRFGLFFPEKRTFFQEGQGIFDFGVGTGSYRVLPFFSRRIGLEEGQPVPILGGGRLTGKTGPYSVGVLAMRTRDLGPHAASTFSVARVKRDVLGRSSVGALFTDRRNSGAEPDNTVVGVDANFAFLDRSRLELFWVRSSDSRSDAGAGPGEETTGPGGESSSAYRAHLLLENDLLGMETEWMEVGDRFDPGVGFVQRRDMDRRYLRAQVSPRPGRFGIRKLYFRSSVDYVESLAGFVQTRDLTGEVEVEFERDDILTLTWQRSLEGLEGPFRIAGVLPVEAGSYEFDFWSLRLATSQSRDLSATFSARGGDFFDGTRQDLGISGIVKASRHLFFDVNWSASDIELTTGKLESHLVGLRTSVAFTPEAWSSALLQWNSVTREFGVNARLRYTYRPGSDIFVVFNERLVNPLDDGLLSSEPVPGDPLGRSGDDWLLRERSLIVKLTYLFRL